MYEPRRCALSATASTTVAAVVEPCCRSSSLADRTARAADVICDPTSVDRESTIDRARSPAWSFTSITSCFAVSATSLAVAATASFVLWPSGPLEALLVVACPISSSFSWFPVRAGTCGLPEGGTLKQPAPCEPGSASLSARRSRGAAQLSVGSSSIRTIAPRTSFVGERSCEHVTRQRRVEISRHPDLALRPARPAIRRILQRDEARAGAPVLADDDLLARRGPVDERREIRLGIVEAQGHGTTLPDRASIGQVGQHAAPRRSGSLG